MSIKEYISEQDKTIQPKLELIYNTIHDAIPDAEERLSWGMPTFWKGRNIIHFAPAKKHIGLYPGSEAIEAFADKLVEYKTSKGAIQFPNDKDLPLELIVAMIMLGIGVSQLKSKEPVGFYTGEKPPKVDQLSDVNSWNKKHGVMWIIYGICIIGSWICSAFIGGDSIYSVIPLCIGTIIPILIMVFLHHKWVKRYFIQ